MPAGLVSAKTVMISPDNDINVTIGGGTTANASLDVKADGIFILTGSLSTIQLSNRGNIGRSATPMSTVTYDITG